MNDDASSGSRVKDGSRPLALDGLSIGDAFGGRFFLPPDDLRTLPPPPWRFSDDTEMAMAVVDVLERHGRIEPDDLALEFARRYEADPDRGYGLSVRRVLEGIASGLPWREAAVMIFDGIGSMGNGGAMRVAPIGTYHADDFEAVVAEAMASAAITHAHPAGQAGAVAVAIATARACREPTVSGRDLLSTVVEHTPPGATRSGLELAATLDFNLSIPEAVERLGNGSRITSPDTVPFALWCAARHLDNYAEALWSAASAGGDNDTNCAIVGAVVVTSAGLKSIPDA